MFGNDARRPAVRLTVAASAATALLCGLAAPAVAAPVGPVIGTGVEGAIPGSYIVVLKPGSDTASRELAGEYGGTVAGDYRSTVRGFHLLATATQARRLAADPAVAFVEQDAEITTTAMAAPVTQAVPIWGLDRLDQRSLPLSGSYTHGSAAGVTAYVIDTGVRLSHQEFGGRAVDGWDFVDNDPVADDCHGHGTHVAGTIGGQTYGVAKDAGLVALKVLGCDGTGSYSGFIAAVDWVTANARRPAVANMSLGGPLSMSLNAAVQRSIAQGVTYAIAAGNENKDACEASPAATAEAITVGATSLSDTRAGFSNYGSCLDIFAPGSSIVSAGTASDSDVKGMSGTSMAAPHVAGAAALVLGAHPDWTPAQVRDDLVANAGADLVADPGAGSPNLLLHTGHLNTV